MAHADARIEASRRRMSSLGGPTFAEAGAVRSKVQVGRCGILSATILALARTCHNVSCLVLKAELASRAA